MEGWGRGERAHIKATAWGREKTEVNKLNVRTEMIFEFFSSFLLVRKNNLY